MARQGKARQGKAKQIKRKKRKERHKIITGKLNVQEVRLNQIGRAHV